MAETFFLPSFSWNRTGKTRSFSVQHKWDNVQTQGRILVNNCKQANKKQKFKTFQPVSDDGNGMNDEQSMKISAASYYIAATDLRKQKSKM